VIARLSDIGGTVRVFSARGAGTTVVLEVTKR
jgi:signal transduction histidine kinase